MSRSPDHSSRLIPVEGHPGLYRDSVSNAIINKNTAELEKKREARQRYLQKEAEVETLKQDVAEIKELLKQLLER